MVSEEFYSKCSTNRVSIVFVCTRTRREFRGYRRCKRYKKDGEISETYRRERVLVLDLTKICIAVIVCEVRVSHRRVIDRPEPSIYIFVMAANKDAFPFRVTFILTPSWRDLYTWSRVKYKLLGIIIVTRSEQETRFERAWPLNWFLLFVPLDGGILAFRSYLQYFLRWYFMDYIFWLNT